MAARYVITSFLIGHLTRFNKIAIQGTPQMRHEHCDELHLLQVQLTLVKYRVLLVERYIDLVAVGQLPTLSLSLAIQIAWVKVWWCVITIPFRQCCLQMRLLAMEFEGR